MAKKVLAGHLRSLYEGQGSLTVQIVEESPDFAKLISCKQSPGIRLAKKRGIAYTVASGDQVVEIDAQQNTMVVGRISRADVPVQQRIYQLK